MFGKPSQKQQPQEQINLQDYNSPLNSSFSIEESQQQKTILQTESEEKSELVTNFEKISRIVSPYFIVVVGLFLSEKNFLLGMFLIILGIFTLLKVSAKDIARFVDWVKSFLGLNNN
jgi:hypothetical protein